MATIRRFLFASFVALLTTLAFAGVASAAYQSIDTFGSFGIGHGQLRATRGARG